MPPIVGRCALCERELFAGDRFFVERVGGLVTLSLVKGNRPIRRDILTAPEDLPICCQCGAGVYGDDPA